MATDIYCSNKDCIHRESGLCGLSVVVLERAPFSGATGRRLVCSDYEVAKAELADHPEREIIRLVEEEK